MRVTSAHLGQNICPVPSKLKFTCLRGVQKEVKSVVTDTMEYCKIPLELALNIVTYAKQLELRGCGTIDMNIFKAQLVRYFGITHMLIVQRMYHACKHIGDPNVDRCKVHRDINTTEYCKMIGLFLGDEKERQVEFVFSVYDIHCSGFLDRASCKAIIQEGIHETFKSDHDLNEAEQVTTEITEILMNTFDLNRDGRIILSEFKKISQINSLYTQALGRCLPNPTEIMQFKEVLEGKTTIEIAAFFRNERRLALNRENNSEKPPMYPIDLELPIETL